MPRNYISSKDNCEITISYFFFFFGGGDIIRYTFSIRLKAYMRSSEMFFQIYTLWFCGSGFCVTQVKASKFTENNMIKRTESQEDFST